MSIFQRDEKGISLLGLLKLMPEIFLDLSGKVIMQMNLIFTGILRIKKGEKPGRLGSQLSQFLEPEEIWLTMSSQSAVMVPSPRM